MAKTKSDAQRVYLKDASTLLLSSSPAISAHLRQTSQDLEGDTTKDNPSHAQSCTACGNVFVPGWSFKTLNGPSKKRTRRDWTEGKHGNVKTVRLQCLKCDAVTIIDSPKSSKRPKSTSELTTPAKRKVDALVTSAAVTPPAAQRSGNADQPPRKRARGKKSTLQSMLADQKTTDTPAQNGFGLGLVDFMKT